MRCMLSRSLFIQNAWKFIFKMFGFRLAQLNIQPPNIFPIPWINAYFWHVLHTHRQIRLAQNERIAVSEDLARFRWNYHWFSDKSVQSNKFSAWKAARTLTSVFDTRAFFFLVIFHHKLLLRILVRMIWQHESN